MATSAFWLLIVTSAGILLIGATLWETRRAGQAAWEVVRVSNKSNRIAERTAKRQLRAYVQAQTAGIDEFDLSGRTGQVPRARVRILNTGQTPAQRVVTRISLHVIDIPMPASRVDELQKAESDMKPVGGRVTLGVNESRTGRLKGGTIDQTQLKNMRAGKARFAIIGVISYFDVFDIKHKTYFCHIYAPHKLHEKDGSYYGGTSQDC